MRGPRAVAPATLAVILACSPAPPTTNSGKVLPDATTLDGWRVAEGPVELGPDTLYEYLDGGASLYLDHGFRSLVHVRYQHGEEPLAAVTLDVFDMGSDLGAFGIFCSGRSPESLPRQWGSEGYRMGTIGASWKGTHFVHGEADDDRPELLAMLDLLMTLVSETIEGGTSLPPVFGLLPPSNRVPRRERWVATDLLGHDFLPGGVLATYEIDGRTAEVFFSELRDGPAAQGACTELRAHQARWGTIDGEFQAFADAGFRFSDPVLGTGTVVVTGRYIAGIYGELDTAAQELLLRDLVSRLESATPRD